MKIMIVNDDGIDAAGLHALIGALCGAHSVFVVAPDRQRSAVSKAMTLYEPLRAERRTLAAFPRVEAYAVNGTPVDCVRLGLGNLVPRPDAVISGINIGANLGTDTLYSGTCAGAQEAALSGVPAVALSCCSFRPAHLDTAAAMAEPALELLSRCPLPFGAFYNVNVPDLPHADIRGMRGARLGLLRYPDAYEKRQDNIGRDYYWAPRDPVIENAEDADTALVPKGYVTVTALSYNNAVPLPFGAEAENSFWEAKHGR